MLTKKGKRALAVAAVVLLAAIALLVWLVVFIVQSAGRRGVKSDWLYYDEKTGSIVVSGDMIKIDNNTVKFMSNETNTEYYFEYNKSKKAGVYDFAVNSDLISRVRADADKGVIVISALMPLVLEATLHKTENLILINAKSPEKTYDKIVILDAGHGGEDVGAIVNSVFEKDINIAVVQKVAELINSGDSGIKAYLIRSGDETVHVTARPFVGNEFADLYVSVHCNTFADSSQPSGTTTHYNGFAELPTGRSGVTSAEFAEIMQRNVSASLNSRDRGTFGGDGFFVLTNSTMPAVLIELGYMTNPEEFAKLQEPDYQGRAALGIYNGIAEAFER